MKLHSLRSASVCCAAAAPNLLLAALQSDDDAAAGGLAACGCFGIFGVILLILLAINIAILVWVAKDAKARGMDNSILWMVLVMCTGLLGLIIYLLARPAGILAPCAHCGNKRLAVAATCPHCKNA